MATAISENPKQSERRWLSGLRAAARGRLAVSMALPVLSGALLLIQTWLLATSISLAVAGHAALAELPPRVAGFGALMAIRIGLGAFAETAGGFAAEAIKEALRRSLFAELMHRRLPVSMANGSSGALAAALVDHVEGLDGYFSRYLPSMIQASFLPLAFAFVLMPVDWVAGTLFLVTAPLIPVFMALVGWGAEAASTQQAAAMQRLAGRFSDRLRGMVTLKLFGRAEAETEAIVAVSEDLRRRTLRVLRIAFLSSAVLEFFAAVGVAGVALYVGLSFLGLVHLRISPLSFEGGLLLLLMASEIYQPLRLLAANYHDRAAARASVTAIAATIGALPPLGVAQSAKASVAATKSSACSLVLGGLTLHTPDRSRRILDQADLLIPAGAHVALLGDSGSGKTTLLEAIARLRDYEGKIWLGKDDIRDLPEAELRARLVYLPQQSRIFHGSIAENIALGLSASDEAIRNAAERACVTSFTDRLPLGLHTVLGEGGFGLSGGEAQRVALARVFLRDPDVILLDEPTSHLDRATEDSVLDGLLDFARRRTLLVATHSADVASRLDRAYRITADRLIAVDGDAPRDQAAAGLEKVA